MKVVPFVSIGDLHFGDHRQDVRRRLGGKHHAFRKAPGVNETDAYDDLGLHLYYDNDDKLEYVETFAPASTTFEGIKMLGRDYAHVEEDLAKAGHPCSFMDNLSVRCDTAGIALYIPNDVVEAVAAFRTGYYS